jgi:hypothetical protein
MQSKDLTKVPPRSAYEKINGYSILARAIDKGRATIAGTNGEYNFDCPVDNMLLKFTGIKGDALKAQLAAGKSDEEIGTWVKEHSVPHTQEEIDAWNESHHHDFAYHNHPDAGKKAWFDGECERLGLDASKTTLFDMLDADDKTMTKTPEGN